MLALRICSQERKSDKPETTQTGVNRQSMKLQPSFSHKPVFWKSVNTNEALFLDSEGVATAKVMMRAKSIANWTKIYIVLSTSNV